MVDRIMVMREQIAEGRQRRAELESEIATLKMWIDAPTVEKPDGIDESPALEFYQRRLRGIDRNLTSERSLYFAGSDAWFRDLEATLAWQEAQLREFDAK